MLQERTKLEKDLSKIITFEELLANISTKPQDSNTLRSLTIEQMTEEFPFLNWTSFFISAFDQNGTLIGSITDQTEVLVQADFLKGVTELVNEYQSTAEGREVMRNYLIWRLIAAFYPDRPVEENQRKERCLKETEEMFAPVVTSMYIQAKGIKKSRDVVDQVEEMVNTMKLAFRGNLQSLGWMSKKAMESAEAKLDQMVDLIGFPDFVLNATWVDDLFMDLDIKPNSYLLNVVSHRSFSRQSELKQFFAPFDRTNWNDFSHMANIATVNAYYNQASNTMVVPIGMLQPPLFWTKPKSLTFGAFGIVVGKLAYAGHQYFFHTTCTTKLIGY